MYPLLYQRRARTGFCAGLIAFALALRLAMIPGIWGRALSGTRQALGSRTLFRLVIFAQTGLTELPGVSAAADEAIRNRPEVAGEGPTPAAEQEQPEDPWQAVRDSGEAGEMVLPFSAAEAEGITLRGNCSYTVDKAALLLQPLDWELQPGPKVLILHSHSCEAYTPSPGLEYEASGDHRTLQADRSVIAVGDKLEAELKKLGVECVHDRSLHDYPDYNRSYAGARASSLELLEKYPSVLLVIDLHRDALEKPVRETAQSEGRTAAPLMLVVGTDEGGLNHPHWQRNLSCALKLQALGIRRNPGLWKALSFRRERFNGDLSPGAFIVEVGSTENTLPEAEASMPELAQTVAELLHLAEQE